jgi:hypothetical protein
VERRTFLVLSAAVVGLAGCTSDPSEPRPTSAPPTSAGPNDPDRLLREDVAQSEVALIAAYRSAIQADPELVADLAPFLAQHEAHLARVAPGFAGGGPVGGGPTSGPATGSPTVPGFDSPPTAATPPTASLSPTASPSNSANVTPDATASSVLAGLAEAETVAQAQRASACDGAQDPGLARDLCLIAASEAQHASALAGWAVRESRS